MGKIENNYFSLGFNDLKYLLKYDEEDECSYNRVAVESQQVVEKILKGIIESCDTIPFDLKVELLGSHNLRKLGTTINKTFNKTLNLPDLAFLKDFYFEARYPGDNFTIVDRETRNKCIDIVMEILEHVKDLCPNNHSVNTMNLF